MPVEHGRNHPDVHQPWARWSEEETLHLTACYANPMRWQTRRALANNWRRWASAQPNVRLHFVELAYGTRPFELTDPAQNADDVQVRTPDYRAGEELFWKENLWNIGVHHFPAGWRWGAAIDADFHMTRHDWALETIHQLQHYEVVQPYSSYTDLSGQIYGQAQVPLRTNSGFFFNYIQNGFRVSPNYFNGPTKDAAGYDGAMMRGVGATGGAIAFRRNAYDAVGGFLDRCPMGHADWYMAFSLVGVEPPDIHTQKYHANYKAYVNVWRERAVALKKNVGYTDGFALHYFHGSKTKRAYSSRDVILAKHQFDPYGDVFLSSDGVMHLTPTKPDLRDDIRRYFISRSEDDPNIYTSEKLMV